MDDRTCQLCGYQFRYPSGLKKHQQRVKSCKPILDHADLSAADLQKSFACKFCGRRFSAQPSLSRHINGECRVAGSAEGLQMLYEHTLRKQQAQLVEQARIIAEQGRQLSMLAGANFAPTPVVAQSVNVNTGVQQVININVFGQEQTAHIDRAGIKDLLDNIIEEVQDPALGALNALLTTAALIYSDPARPENLTCYLPNKKKEDVMVHGAAGWEIQPSPRVLPPMVKKSVDALFSHQPFEGGRHSITEYGDLMMALRANEQAYKAGKQMKTILVRNRNLLKKALGALPQ